MRSAMFLFVSGLMVTFGSVGAIETDAPLLDSLIIGCVGLMIMGCGALKFHRDRTVDNPTLW